ncbi:MAG TPA: hypothetical protein VHZ81_10490 [Galbitalea sp.]|nr:hypothetical protein [Galbitalea sp.]
MGCALAHAIDAAIGDRRSVSMDVSDYRALDEATLLRPNTLTAEAGRLTQAHAALIAGEISRRSTPDLGSDGLAQRAGHRNAEQFIKITTGASGRAATTAVRTGILLGEMADDGALDASTGEVSLPSQPWLRAITDALQSGRSR